MTPSAHFTPALFEFLADLAVNNRREWFQANKNRYETHVKDALLAFVSDFGERLAEISPHMVADPRPSGGSMFRIYRDVRFSKDKSPYKTNASVHFRHEVGREVHGPGLYLHMQPLQRLRRCRYLEAQLGNGREDPRGDRREPGKVGGARSMTDVSSRFTGLRPNPSSGRREESTPPIR